VPGILVIPSITRQQLAARIARRGRRLEFFQIHFEKMVGDDQRLDRLAGIVAAAAMAWSAAASIWSASSGCWLGAEDIGKNHKLTDRMPEHVLFLF
jgi:hypothetical protein